MLEKKLREKPINNQIKLIPQVDEILKKFTKDRSEPMGSFLTDLLYILDEKIKKPEEVEKFFGKLMYKKYFEER